MNQTTQAQAYSISVDTVDGGKIFNGRVTFDDLNNEPSFTWLKKGLDEYVPEARELVRLDNLKNYSLVVFLGTWCDDSHNLIPKLEKVLKAPAYPLDKLTMYGVDRAKTTKDGSEKKYGITLVPTIIVFDASGKEVGRITESVKKSIEEDLADIIKY